MAITDMPRVDIFIVCIFISSLFSKCQGKENPDIYKTTVELIRSNGYPCEEHFVTTADGYILALHRIPAHKVSENSIYYDKKQQLPIIMQHGLLSSSADWVMNSPDKAPGYVFHDAGYDVWLGNARGNTYSRNHTSLSPDAKQFWQFSWDEMAYYDVPAIIDYILKTTQSKELFYMGHSMGTTMFWAAMDMHPEYNKKVRAMVGLGPVATVNHIISPIRYLAPFVYDFDVLTDLLGDYEFLPNTVAFKKWMEFLCETHEYEAIMCEDALFFFMGVDGHQFNITWLPVMLGHSPAGTSTMTVAHYAQEVNSGKFQHFDYGSAKENIKHYGQPTPPEYDLKKVTVPVILMWGLNDWLADPEDVIFLAEGLPTVVADERVKFAAFNHLDFLWGIDAKTLVYDVILKYLPFF